jgi:hypothetical protein
MDCNDNYFYKKIVEDLEMMLTMKEDIAKTNDKELKDLYSGNLDKLMYSYLKNIVDFVELKNQIIQNNSPNSKEKIKTLEVSKVKTKAKQKKNENQHEKPFQLNISLIKTNNVVEF